jgi:DUF1365 family protein
MAGIYRQRHPEHTVFYRVFFHYFELDGLQVLADLARIMNS